MSKQNETTITEFFHLKEHLSGEPLKQLESETRFQQMRNRIESELKNFKLPEGFYELMLTQLLDLLNIEIPDLMVNSWSKYEELTKYLNKEKYPPDKTYYVPLVAHTVVSEHSPHLEPTINRIALGKIKIKVIFKIKLDGALLKVRDGQIEGFTLGKGSGSGSVAVADVQLVERSSKPWDIPKAFTLKKPMAIPDLRKLTGS